MGSLTDSCLEFPSKDESDRQLEYKLAELMADRLDQSLVVEWVVRLLDLRLEKKLAMLTAFWLEFCLV